MDFKEVCRLLRDSSKKLAVLKTAQKNNALLCVIKSLDKNRSDILHANQKDVENAKKNGVKESLIDRLFLTNERIDAIIQGIHEIIAQTDPIGEILCGWKTSEGLEIRQVRVPIGVTSIIYESRPNVTVEAFCLAYKSGNALLLRGSSQAQFSNTALVKAIQEGLTSCKENGGIPEALALTSKSDRSDITEILNARGLIDVVLPRGGAELIKTVVQNAKIPVIETGSGVCHLYVDESADLQNAVLIAENAKIQRPGVCNSIETVLVHKSIANDFLPLLEKKFAGRVELRLCERSYSILHNSALQNCKNCVKAAESDFGFEFLDYILAVKVVDSLDEAISFINAHNTLHSETIVTQNIENAKRFQAEIDAACVYVNASTRFTDGGIFGFGAELGISTQKFHVRGPMGLKALTVTKYLIDGTGQIRE